MNTEIIKEIDVQNIMTKSALPVGGYSVNPYVGCPHACKYCYASFMKRFTGHTEPWGAFLDVKNWKPIANPHKYDGERIVIGSVTDGYNPYEEKFCRTRRLLEELRGSNAEIMICTKSDLVLRDLDLLKQFPKVTVSWSVNTLDERFRADMDNAVSIERRLKAMRQVYEAGIRTVCVFRIAHIPRNNRCEGNYRESERICRFDMARKPESARAVQGRDNDVYP